jgi:DNA-binding IscR family transcriptional regulator
MIFFSRAPDHLLSLEELNQKAQFRASKIARALKLLIKARLIIASTGAHRTYKLARSPEAITAADLMNAVERGSALDAPAAAPVGLSDTHKVSRFWRSVEATVRGIAAEITLAEIAEDHGAAEFDPSDLGATWASPDFPDTTFRLNSLLTRSQQG